MPKVSPSGGWIWSNHGKYNGFGSILCFGNFVFFVVSGTVLNVIFVDFRGSLDDILVLRKLMQILIEKPGWNPIRESQQIPGRRVQSP